MRVLEKADGFLGKACGFLGKPKAFKGKSKGFWVEVEGFQGKGDGFEWKSEGIFGEKEGFFRNGYGIQGEVEESPGGLATLARTRWGLREWCAELQADGGRRIQKFPESLRFEEFRTWEGKIFRKKWGVICHKCPAFLVSMNGAGCVRSPRTRFAGVCGSLFSANPKQAGATKCQLTIHRPGMILALGMHLRPLHLPEKKR